MGRKILIWFVDNLSTFVCNVLYYVPIYWTQKYDDEEKCDNSCGKCEICAETFNTGIGQWFCGTVHIWAMNFTCGLEEKNG